MDQNKQTKNRNLEMQGKFTTVIYLVSGRVGIWLQVLPNSKAQVLKHYTLLTF